MGQGLGGFGNQLFLAFFTGIDLLRILVENFRNSLRNIPGQALGDFQ